MDNKYDKMEDKRSDGAASNSTSSSSSESGDSSSSESDELEDSTPDKNMNNGSTISVQSIANSKIENIGDRITIKDLTVKMREPPRGFKSRSSRDSTIFEDHTFRDAQKYLIQRYSDQLNVLTPISWCPTFRQEMKDVYTNLHMKATNKKFKFVEDSKIPLQAIFNQNLRVSPRKDLISIFIEGASGYGKTTLTSKIAYDWATMHANSRENNYVQKFSLVIVIALRKFQGLDLEDYLFQEVFPNDFKIGRRRRYLMRRLEKEKDKILFILDGYDELKGDANKELIVKILDRQFLPNCSIILTSQPNQMDEVLQYCNLRLKIAGYEFEYAKEYIVKYFSDKTVNDTNLLSALCQSNDNIYRQLSACPLLLLLLCVMTEEKGGILPSKSTEVLKELVKCTIRRSFTKKGQNIDDPMEQHKEILCALGDLCLQALIQDQGYLSGYELKNMIKSEVFDFGLFFLASNANVTNSNNIYEPVHRIFMEFLAAMYLKSVIDDVEVINNKLNFIFLAPSFLPFTLIFLSGLLSDEAHKLFTILPRDVFVVNPSTTFSLLNESGCNENNVRAIQCLLPPEQAFIDKNDIVFDGWYQILMDPQCNLKVVDVEINPEYNLNQKYKKLFQLIGGNNRLESITIRFYSKKFMVKYEADEISSLIRNISRSTSICEFSVIINEMETVGCDKYENIVSALCYFLKKSKSLQKVSINLELSHKQISDITYALMVSDTITKISFPFLCCSKQSMIELSQLFYSRSNLTKEFLLENFQEKYDRLSIQRSLSLQSDDSCPDSVETSCSNHESSFHHIMQALSNPNCSIETLDLSNCSCSYADFRCFGFTLSSDVNLKTFILHNTSSFNQVKPIINSLLLNKNLKKLDLTSDNITLTDENIEYIAETFDNAKVNLRLTSLTIAHWKYLLNKKSSLHLLLRIRKYLKYLEYLDVSNSDIIVYFDTPGDVFSQLKKLKPACKEKTRLCMNKIKVNTRSKKLSIIDCFPLALYFPTRKLDAASLCHLSPKTDTDFRRVFKLISKMTYLQYFSMKNWNVTLNNPEHIFERLNLYLQAHSLLSLDMSQIQLRSWTSGKCLIHEFFSCLLSSLKLLNQVIISAHILNKDVSEKIVKGVVEHFSGEELTLTISNERTDGFGFLKLKENEMEVTRILTEGRVINLIEAFRNTRLLVEVDSNNGWIKVKRLNSKMQTLRRRIFQQHLKISNSGLGKFLAK